jgi:hypothetical protein
MQCMTSEECNQWRENYLLKASWKYQITCHTPLKRLPLFTQLLLEQLQPVNAALIIIDQIVFDVPEGLTGMRRAASEQRRVREAPGHLFENENEGLKAMLETVYSGWTDFRLLVTPPHHALLADHDEYTTFFSASREKIAQLHETLKGLQIPVVRYRAKAP